MAIQVQGPDGQSFEFPDGTPRETMRAAMQKRYSSASAPAPVASQPPLGAEPKASLFRSDSDFQERSGVGALGMLGAAARDMFSTREGTANYLAEKAGGSVAWEGSDPLVKLQDGSQYRLNDPGIDNADLANLAGNTLAMLTPMGWAARLAKARNIGMAGRAALQAGTGAGTDAALQATVSGGQIDPLRTAFAGVGGGAGELIGTGVGAARNALAAAGRKSSGANTVAATDLLQNSGAPITPDAIAKIVPQMEQIVAGANPNAILGQAEHGFQYTLGQRLTDPAKKFEQLTREETLRQTPGGFSTFDALRQNNASALDTALTTMGQKFGGKAATTPAEMVQGAQSTLKRQADELDSRISDAYGKAGEGARAAVGVDSIKTLPVRLKTAVQDFGIDSELTPASHRTLAQISKDAAGIADAIEGGKVTGVTLKALETQRRIINNRIGSAANPTDKAAMMALKREYDGWVDEAVDTALISGDPAALAALKEARGLRAEFGKRFEGKGDADKFIEGLVNGTRTPEELMNVALGASQVSKAGGARFIERLRVAAADDPGIMGSLRSAHLSRLTRGNNGEPLAMGQIVRNVKQTEFSNNSVVKALYSPAEWAEVKRLAAAIEPLVAKGDFAKSSGTAERLMRTMTSRMGGGFIGGALDALGGLVTGAKAQNAIAAPVRQAAQSPQGIAPAAAALLSEVGR